jgi:hypothetical protein
MGFLSITKPRSLRVLVKIRVLKEQKKSSISEHTAVKADLTYMSPNVISCGNLSSWFLATLPPPRRWGYKISMNKTGANTSPQFT